MARSSPTTWPTHRPVPTDRRRPPSLGEPAQRNHPRRAPEDPRLGRFLRSVRARPIPVGQNIEAGVVPWIQEQGRLCGSPHLPHLRFIGRSGEELRSRWLEHHQADHHGGVRLIRIRSSDPQRRRRRPRLVATAQLSRPRVPVQRMGHLDLGHHSLRAERHLQHGHWPRCHRRSSGTSPPLESVSVTSDRRGGAGDRRSYRTGAVLCDRDDVRRGTA